LTIQRSTIISRQLHQQAMLSPFRVPPSHHHQPICQSLTETACNHRPTPQPEASARPPPKYKDTPIPDNSHTPMSNYPTRTHVRSFSSPNYEREPFIQGETYASSLLTPGRTAGWTPPREPTSPAWSQKSSHYSTRPPPRPYRSYVSEMSDERYLLNDGYVSAQKLAEIDIEMKLEKDARLKKWIRRFRFVVRVLNLVCRCVSPYLERDKLMMLVLW
jgi:hypothetical protein